MRIARVVDYRTYAVQAKAKAPLLDFMLGALRGRGCRILNHSEPSIAPFRIAFETPTGERMGIVAYAFLANTRPTRNRPSDEFRFQVKYGSKDGRYHELWQDPYGLYTTLFLGIDPERGFFVGADATLHSPTRLFISVEFKHRHVDDILKAGWAAWERDRRQGDEGPVEVLVGGTAERFLDYIQFEREAHSEDQGHRHWLADHWRLGLSSASVPAVANRTSSTPITASRLHALALEFELQESEVLDLIQTVPRLKMAVRGWVAEEHLVRALQGIEGVTDCTRTASDSGPDVALRYERSRVITIECKNVLRKRDLHARARLDFQRTRASKKDPCSRYYRPDDFDIVAACLHSVTDRWEFRFIPSGDMEPHGKCLGRLSSNVRIDERWTAAAAPILRRIARAGA